MLEVLCEQVWKLKWRPTHRRALPSHFCSTSRNATRIPWWIAENNSLELPAGGGKSNHFEIHQNILFSTRLTQRETSLPDANLLWFYQSLTDLGGARYPTLGPCSHPVPATLVNVTVEGHRLTKDCDLIIELHNTLPYTHLTITSPLQAYLPELVLPITSYLTLNKKNFKAHWKAKDNHLKRQNKR